MRLYKERINYLDVAKFIGIFCIYLGHFGTYAGAAYPFVFTFHVPLFFFLSGCSETMSRDVPWHKYVFKAAKSILLPWLMFALTSLVLCAINEKLTPDQVLHWLKMMAKGCVRNQFMAGSLWFLTCLFVVKFAFFFMRRLLRHKALIVAACFVLFVIAEKVMNPRPISIPSMPYNIDSACYYIIYFALGYCLFDYIKLLLQLDTAAKKITVAAVGAVCFVYSALLFFGVNLLLYVRINKVMVLLYPILCPMITIVLVLIVSRLLQDVPWFVELGQNTLYLCGSEYIIRMIFPSFLLLIGLNFTVPTPMTAYVGTALLLYLCNKFLVPVEKAILKKCKLIQ